MTARSLERVYQQNTNALPTEYHQNVRTQNTNNISIWGLTPLCNNPACLPRFGVWVFLFIMVKPLDADYTLNGGSAARSQSSQDTEDTLTVGDAARVQNSQDAEDTFTVGDAARSRSSHDTEDTLNVGSCRSRIGGRPSASECS